jgi:hypothetical protein
LCFSKPSAFLAFLDKIFSFSNIQKGTCSKTLSFDAKRGIFKRGWASMFEWICLCVAQNVVHPELSGYIIRKLSAKPAAWFSTLLRLTRARRILAATNCSTYASFSLNGKGIGINEFSFI